MQYKHAEEKNLDKAIVRAVETQTAWKVVTESQDATAKLKFILTELTPGSRAARTWAAEFGAGHAIFQIEGTLSESNTGAELAAFADKHRDTGAVGFEDISGDAGPTLVNRMLEAFAHNLIKEIQNHLHQGSGHGKRHSHLRSTTLFTKSDSHAPSLL